MNYRRWRVIFFVASGVGGVVAAVGIVTDLILAVVGGVVVALGQLGAHLYGEAAERQLTAVAGTEGTAQKEAVARGQAIIPPESIKGFGAHSEIDDAFEYVKQGRPEVTIDLLRKIKRDRWDRLDNRERFRVLANIGNAQLASQDKAGAAENYLRALAFQPSDEDARSLEALAYFLLDDRERAYDLAVLLCSSHPNLGRAQMIRVRTAPVELPFDELVESVPSSARSHPEVALALHDRAISANRLAEAEQVLREPSQGEDWVQLKLALGSTLLQQELAEVRLSADGPITADRARLCEAVQLLGEALRRIPPSDPEGFKFGAYLNRGTARQLLGNRAQAHEDFQRARELNPGDERVAIASARSAYSDGNDLDAAITSLDSYLEDHQSPLVEILLAGFLRQRGAMPDLERSRALLEGLLHALNNFDEVEQRAAVVETLADIYVSSNRGDEAVTLLAGLPEESLGAARRHAILGNVLRTLGRTEDAVSRAAAASTSLGSSSDWGDVRRVALLLESLGRFADALVLWRRIVPPEFVAAETYHLLHCAKESGEATFLLDFCRQLRAAGHHDHQCLAFEVETLVQYSAYPAAREVFLEYLRIWPEDKIARLNLTLLALQQGWGELVDYDPSKLPVVEELKDAGIGARALNVLRAGPDPTLAVDYGYRLYRRFPDESEAHIALIVAVLAPGRKGLRIDKPETAVAGTAVRYREGGDESEGRWVVLEDGENPSLSRDEYPLSHPLAEAVLGRRVGDDFALPTGFRERTATVLELQDKRIYRAQDLMLRWPDRFPDKPFIEPVPIKATGSVTHDFAEVIKILDARNESLERLKNVYEEGRIPISTLAHFRGISVFETVRFLAATPGLPLRAARGSTEDLEKAFTLLDGTTSAVLDPTALASLSLLGEVSLLESLPFRCLVTEGGLQELRSLAREEPPHGKSGIIGSESGRLWIHEITEDEEAAKRERLQQIISGVEESCEVIGGVDLARVEPGLRNQLTECVVRASAEAAAAASLSSATFWTDDELFYQLVKGDLPVARVWTQAILFWMHAKGLLDSLHRSRATARMLQFEYIFTSSSPQAVLDTCEAAAWRTEDPDLAAVLADFGNPLWNFETALRMTTETVGRVWREALIEEHARAVTGRLLVHLADRSDHLKIVSSLIENVDSLLGLAVARAASLREVLVTFLKGGGPSL